jgi:hypothetical protein
MTWQLDTWHDADLTWIIDKGHCARIFGDDRWNLSAILSEDAVVSVVFGEVSEDAVVSIMRSLCPPSSGLALFGARPLLI